MVSATIASVASVSVLFPSKDRGKNGASKRGGASYHKEKLLPVFE